jgi:phosphoribosylformylglycinamidine cyclo-ligase
MTSVYAKAGVNVALGDLFSKYAASVCRETWGISPHVVVHDFAEGYFRGPRAYEFIGLPAGCKMDSGMDGVGTKTSVIAAALSPHTVGYDLLAMTAMDRTRWGYLPLYLDNILDVATLGKSVDDQTYRFFCGVISGLRDAAIELGVVLGYGGEVAELGVHVGADNPNAVAKFNWAGHMQGAMHPDKIIRGENMQSGDIVVALREQGARSNGISAIRRALKARFGSEWWNNPDAEGAINAAAAPSVLYDKFFAKLNGWFEKDFAIVVPVKCIAHISGGGIPGKLAEDILFRLGFSAELDNLPDPPRILLDCLEWLRESGEIISDSDCYKMWHGGPGVIAVVAPEHEGALHHYATAFGIRSQSCGRITKRSEPRLVLKSKFGSGKVLEFT